MTLPMIAIVGAAGQMTSITALALAETATDHRLRLLDINTTEMRRLYAHLPTSRAETLGLDLGIEADLRASLAGAALVIHGAGPFHKTAAPVRAMCLELGIDYLDIDDDVESTLEAIALDAPAKAAGVALYVGHGASPGFTNMLALDLLRRFDEPRTVEVAWTVGDEGKTELGRAVAEHTMHIGAGPCLTWRDGHAVTRESYGSSQVFPMGQNLGDYRLYESAHPEPVTLPWSFPQLREASCWGGLHPQANNGLLRGLAVAQTQGRLTMDEACGFLQAVLHDEFGTLKGWRAAFGGMLSQIRRGENDWSNLRQTLWNAARGVHGPMLSGMAARVAGRRNGLDLALVRQCVARQPAGFADSMARITGLSAAAFALMVLLGPKQSGFKPPESWADPDQFYQLCAALGGHPDQPVVGPIMEAFKS